MPIFIQKKPKKKAQSNSQPLLNSSPSQEPSSVESLLATADSSIENHKYKEARETLIKAVSLHKKEKPDKEIIEKMIEKLLMVASIYKKKNEYQKAASLIREAASSVRSINDKKCIDEIIGRLLEIINEIEDDRYRNPQINDEREMAKCWAYAAALGGEVAMTEVRKIAKSKNPKSEIGKAICNILLLEKGETQDNKIKQSRLTNFFVSYQKRYNKKLITAENKYKGRFANIIRRSAIINGNHAEETNSLAMMKPV